MSFHKILFHERANLRLAEEPAEQRPIIRILLKGNSDTYLVHQSVLDAWQKAGVETVCYDIKEKYQSFSNLCNLDMYYGSLGSVSFRNMDDFQNNNEPMFYDELDDDDD